MRTPIYFFLLLLLCSGFGLAAQSIRPADLVAAQVNGGATFAPINPFYARPSDKAKVVELPARTEYQIIGLQASALERWLADAPMAVRLSLPYVSKQTLTVNLVQVDPFTDDFQVLDSRQGPLPNPERGIHYRGVVEGSEASLVAISVFPEEVMGFISSDAGTLVLGRLQSADWRGGEHILYDDREVLGGLGLDCATPDDGYVYGPQDLRPLPAGSRDLSDCVRLYYEIDFDIFLSKGGTNGTLNFISGIHNQIATLYANEQINTSASQIFIWSNASPYVNGSSGQLLSQFQSLYNGFNGNLASLFSYKSSGGVAAGFNGLCPSNPDNAMCFSSIGNTYAVVPTYSWTVDVATHELGHLLGSRHTHACVWNGNGTAIDGCAGFTEGSCFVPGIPGEGGTIMSYCHLESVGKNLALGFGPQPGNVIRNRVQSAACLAPCDAPSCEDGILNGEETGIDCGGPDCPACPTCSDGIQNGDETGVDCGGSDCLDCPCLDNALTLTITLDNYPQETTWSVVDEFGSVLAGGGPYGQFPDGATVTDNICLENGCFTFFILDSYGDGICCGFGQGSYALTDAEGNLLAGGGNFGASESTNFCLDDAPPPTCDDGIQNGSEEGIDCGGPDCPPCDEICPNETFLTSDGFEQNFGNWNDGGSDCVRYNGAAYANSGNYSIRLRDNSSTSVMTSDLLFAATYQRLLVDFSYFPRSMDEGDRFVLELSTDGGNNFIETHDWQFGIDFENESHYAEAAIIETALNDQTVLRFRCDASSNSDWVYIDDVSISGCGRGAGPTCNDGIQNGDEEGVDCGGTFCAPCATCNDGIQNGDETGVDCGGPDCEPCTPDPTCDDGIQNGDETGVDCGGPDCEPCTPDPTCDDGVQNGDETGVDCGGPDCEPCTPDPTCDDGVQNGDETGVDCGGPDCEPCTPDPTCDDGVQNGDETGVDCGGPDCEPCTPDPTCDDGVQNGDEEGVDCGGSCPPCDDGDDCVSGMINSEDFEGSLGIWNDGGSDCSHYMDTEYANSGSFSVRLRDNSSTSVTYTDALALQAYQNITVSFYYYSRSMDNASEGFTLELSTDGGNNFVIIEEWNYEGEFVNDQGYEDVVEIAGPFTANTVLRFVCHGSSNTDWIYLDDITITGCLIIGQPAAPNTREHREFATEKAPLLQAPRVFPNPTSDGLQLRFTAREATRVSLLVTDLTGRTVWQQPLDVPAGPFHTRIETANLEAGVYHLHLLTEQGRVTERFVLLRN